MEGSETILVSNGDHIRGVCYSANGAYRTYAESVSFIGINNEFDDDRTEFMGNIIEYLAGYQGVLTGTVTDRSTSEPIVGAEIEIIDCNLNSVSSQEGEFEINRFPVEEFTISIHAEGYSSYQAFHSFEGERELSIEVMMERDASVHEDKSHPSSFGITSIFPNPFNPSTTIFLEFNQPSSIKLTVHALNGRIVTELYEGRLKAGKYSYPLVATNWSTGIYLVRLSNNDQQFVRKIVLNR